MPQVIQLSTSEAVSVHSVVNRTDFNLFKNVTNEVEFLIKGVDRKPVNLRNKTLTIYIVDERSNTLAIQSTLVVVDENRGHCRMVLTPSQVAGLSIGYFRYSVTVDRNGEQLLIYTDQSRSLRGFLELFNGPLPSPQPSTAINQDDFTSATWGIPLDTYYVAESYPGSAQRDNHSGQHTLAIYTFNFSGTFAVEASLENAPPTSSSDWFPVTEVSLNEKTGITSLQFVGSYMWVRFYYKNGAFNSGTITKVLFKN